MVNSASILSHDVSNTKWGEVGKKNTNSIATYLCCLLVLEALKEI